MNAWLRPYRRALNLEEPTVNISEEEQFNAAIELLIEKIYLLFRLPLVYLMV